MSTRIATGELLAMHAALRQIEADGTPQPWRLAYAAARNLRRLDAVVAAFEAARLALVNTHARRDAEGNVVTDGPNVVLERAEEFAAAFRALQEHEEDIVLHKVAGADMPSSMPVGIAAALLAMIDDGETKS